MTVENGPSRAGGSRVLGIDTLRGLSAAAVFVCHVGGYWTFLDLPSPAANVLSFGAHGVDVFIVISGFCLALPFAAPGRRVATGAFYGRRAWRILPAYWVALAVATVLAVVPATARHVVAEPATAGDVVVHVVGMQTWLPSTLGTINGSLWSISLEIQLYLVFPILVLVWRRFGVGVLVAGSALLAAVWWLLGIVVPASGDPAGLLGENHALPARLVQFALGVACADMVRRGRAPGAAPVGVAWVVSGVAAALGYASDLSANLDLVLWGLFGASSILLLAGPVGRRAASKATEEFGLRSFSFYLLHQPVVLLSGVPLAAVSAPWPVTLVGGGLLCFALATGAGAVLYRFVERPSHLVGKRRYPVVVRSASTPAEAHPASPASVEPVPASSD